MLESMEEISATKDFVPGNEKQVHIWMLPIDTKLLKNIFASKLSIEGMVCSIRIRVTKLKLQIPLSSPYFYFLSEKFKNYRISGAILHVLKCFFSSVSNTNSSPQIQFISLVFFPCVKECLNMSFLSNDLCSH